jgi:formylglycine-generating enzyme required for sulfatase activity
MPEPDAVRENTQPAAAPPGPDGAATHGPDEPTGSSAGGGSSPSDLPARIGRYEVRKLLGEGAFGRVYRGFDPELLRDVAIKVPHRHRLTPAFRERFLREGRAAAQIHHANVCPIHDVGTDGDLPFIVMHFVRGGTLSGLLERGSPLPPSDAVDVVRKLALGVAAAHATGVTHRDLKPQNVLWDEANREVLVTDFGLARIDTDATMTVDGAVMGTPKYMAPEQAAGDTKKVGPLSDVYALGVILYELLVGNAPFEGSAQEILGKKLFADFPPPSRARPGLDPRLDAICRKAMATKPEERFASAKEFAAALADYQRAGERPTGRRAARGWLIPSAALVVLAGIAVAVVLLPHVKKVGGDAGSTAQGDTNPTTPKVHDLPPPRVAPPVVAKQDAPQGPPPEAQKNAHGPEQPANTARTLPPGEKEEPFEYVIDGVKRTGTRRVLTLAIADGQTMEFVRIPKGSFLMGAPAGEPEAEGDERFSDEMPQRRVEISRDFYLGKYEVTQAQYKAVTGESPSQFTGDRLPVEQVTWDEAMRFCEALSRKTQRKLRLPSEAEWEYACRAGTSTPFHFGAKLNGDLANCDGDFPYGTAVKGTNNKVTTAVGSYPANPWGLHDMHGNVSEWCRDYHGPYSALSSDPDPVQLTRQPEDRIVIRGGSWVSIAWNCRAARRHGYVQDYRSNDVGFRVLLAAE